MRNTEITFILPLLFVVHAASSPASIHCMVLNVTDTSASIRWEPAGSGVQSCVYGTTLDYSGETGVDVHSVQQIKLKNLLPSTRYYYNLTRNDSLLFDENEAYFFSTAPADNNETVVFAVIGDTRGGEESFLSDHRSVISSILLTSYPRFLIHTGDLTNAETESGWDEFLAAESPLLRQCPLFPVRGNSDVNRETFRRRFSLPVSLPSSGPLCYAFRFGSVFCINLDIQRKRTAQYYEEVIGPQSEQSIWLEKQLRSFTRHLSSFTVVSFYSPVFDPTGRTDKKLREVICPLLEHYGVDLVLNGGVHSFVYREHNGVDYVITGGGGAALEHLYTGKNSPIIFSYTAFHHVRVTARHAVLSVEAIDRSGTVFFSHSITASAPEESPLLKRDRAMHYDTGFDTAGVGITIYSMPDCEACDQLRYTVLPGIPGVERRMVRLVDVSTDKNFSAYQLLEKRLDGVRESFPVVQIGTVLLSGDKLHPDTIRAYFELESRVLDTEREGAKVYPFIGGMAVLIAVVLAGGWFVYKQAMKPASSKK